LLEVTAENKIKEGALPMKNLMKALILSSLLIPAGARAEFSFSCGEGREKGAEQAEVGFVDSLDSAMKFFLKGSEQPDEKLGFKANENNSWMITQDLGEKAGSRRFEFSITDSSVQEFRTSASGKDKKIGAAKKCDYKQAKPEPAHP
jgi:hypothetical protein